MWFILSEEDKASDTALEYWFRAADLDCDGSITPSEMWHFYEEQMKRLEGLSQEPVLFEDVLCQLHDMLQPAKEGAYTLADLKRTKPQSGLLFNTLFNLHKFLAFENRDPFALRAEAQGEDGSSSEWDRFARAEYLRLAVEDEPDDMQVCGGGLGDGRGGAGHLCVRVERMLCGCPTGNRKGHSHMCVRDAERMSRLLGIVKGAAKGHTHQLQLQQHLLPQHLPAAAPAGVCVQLQAAHTQLTTRSLASHNPL